MCNVSYEQRRLLAYVSLSSNPLNLAPVLQSKQRGCLRQDHNNKNCHCNEYGPSKLQRLKKLSPVTSFWEIRKPNPTHTCAAVPQIEQHASMGQDRQPIEPL